MWHELALRLFGSRGAGKAPDAADAALEEAVAHEKLRLIIEQAPRVRMSVLLLDIYIVWLMSGIGELVPAVLLIVLHQAMHAWRWSIPRGHQRQPGPALVAQRRLEISTALIGMERGMIAIPLFLQPVGITHYICTTVLVGQMAGATGSMAGLTRGFSIWAAAMCLPTAIAWLMQGTALTVPIGVLMVLLLAALVGVVRENAATLHKTMSLKRQMESIAASLRMERDRAEEASRAKTRFFAAANHDLRQPLQTLRYQVAQLECAAQEPPVNAKVHGIGLDLARSLADSEKLLEGLLDISRLEAGAMPTRLRSLSAPSVLRAIAAQFRPQAEANGLALEIDLSDGTSAGHAPSEALWVLADRDQLLRVLANLTGNALKFTREGRVSVRAWRESGHEPARTALGGHDGHDPTAGAPRIVFRVEDTGPGIAADELPRVFQEFYQVGNDARRGGQGLGLGLSIVQRLVERMGGAVAVTSTPGAGTAFEVAFPAAPHAPEDAEAAPQPAGAPLLQPLDARVLAVDDDPVLLASLGALLHELGSDVRTAAGGDAALALVEQGFQPEILLLDHRLRGETGLEVLERLRARIGPLPAVLLTGDTTPELEHGADDGHFLIQHKPVNPGRLVALIRATVGVERESRLEAD